MHNKHPYPPELDGFWKDLKKGFKKAFTPPKAVRKFFKRAFTPSKKFRKAFERATTPPKALRKALTPPKAVRKLMKRNPWLNDVVEGALTAVSFLPIPGIRVITAGLDILYQTSMASWQINDMKRAMRRAAHDELNIMAEEGRYHQLDLIEARTAAMEVDRILDRSKVQEQTAPQYIAPQRQTGRTGRVFYPWDRR